MKRSASWIVPPGLAETVSRFHAVFSYFFKKKGDQDKPLRPLMIRGPRGIGKTLFWKTAEAKFRHVKPECPFVRLNFAALHEGTIESALFGHEDGSGGWYLSSRWGKEGYFYRTALDYSHFEPNGRCLQP